MRLLFDTQLWVWSCNAPDRVPAAARAAFMEPANELVWSVVTVWEVAIKFALGRADFLIDPAELLAFLRRGDFTELPVLAEHTLPIIGLPKLHKDPFDRLLIAQAITEDATLVTTDGRIAAYPGPILHV